MKVFVFGTQEVVVTSGLKLKAGRQRLAMEKVVVILGQIIKVV